MKASHELMMFAKVMLAIFVGLAVFSLMAMVRSFYRPLDATREKVASVKKTLLLSSWVMLAAVGVAVQAIVSTEYYMLGAAGIMLCFLLPLLVLYLRLRTALQGRPPGS